MGAITHGGGGHNGIGTCLSQPREVQGITCSFNGATEVNIVSFELVGDACLGTCGGNGQGCLAEGDSTSREGEVGGQGVNRDGGRSRKHHRTIIFGHTQQRKSNVGRYSVGVDGLVSAVQEQGLVACEPGQGVSQSRTVGTAEGEGSVTGCTKGTAVVKDAGRR